MKKKNNISYPDGKFFAFIPSNLNLPLLLQSNPPDFPYKLDKFYYLIDLVDLIPAQNKDIELKDGFVPFLSPLLKKFLHDEYPKYLDYLRENGILITDNQYIKGNKSKGYKLTPLYESAELKQIQLTDNTLCKRLERHKQEEELTGQLIYPELFTFFCDIEIKEKAAIDFITDQIQQGSEKFKYQFRNVHRLVMKDWWFRRDFTGKRLHTNIVSLKSELRRFLHYKGQSLVSVDIRNSQMYIGTKPILDHYNAKIVSLTPATAANVVNDKEGAAKLPELAKQLPKSPSNYVFHELKLTHVKDGLIRLVAFPQDVIEATRKNVILFIQLAFNGDLYDYFGKEITNATGKTFTDADRPELKAEIFATVFGDLKKFTPTKKLFKHVFPSIYEVFAIEKKKAHRDLPIKLQQIEAAHVLDICCKRIHNERPKLFITTIHDSIITTIGNENYIHTVLEEELGKSFGVPPTLKVEKW